MVDNIFQISSQVVGGAGEIVYTILGAVESFINAVINLF